MLSCGIHRSLEGRMNQDEGLVVVVMNNKHVEGKIYAREIISNIHYTNHNTIKTRSCWTVGIYVKLSSEAMIWNSPAVF